jgi:hypothetical protein
MWLSVSFLLFVHLNLSAQTTGEVRAQRCDTTAVWTVEDCMRYAVAHSHGLRQRELQLDNSKAWHLQAIGALLPSISASASGQWNFGRAIDPETNTYTNVSTLGSGFGLSTNVPLFDGLYRLYALRAARADVLLQKNALQSERDQVALATYQACVEVVYAQETVHLAEEKLRESRSLLRQTQVMEEEGLKSPADVAQVQAQAAADELTLTRQQAQQETAMLKLKEVMGLDSEGPSLSLSLTPNPSPNGEGRIYPQEQNTNGGQEAKVSTPLSIRRGAGGEAGKAGWTRGEFRVLLLGLFIAVFQQWCGTNVIFNYAQEIFVGAGFDVDGMFINIVITGIANVVFTFVALYTIERWGRRTLMLIGAGGLGLIYLTLGTCYFFEVKGVLMVLLVVTAISVYAMTLGPVTWTLLAEIFPNRIRGVAMAICTFALWVGCCTLTFSFPSMNAALGSSGTFWIYSAICICAFIFLYHRCPETKGKSLEELEHELIR